MLLVAVGCLERSVGCGSLHSRDGSVAPEVWEHNKSIFAALVHQPGAQQYLKHRREVLHPDFVAVIDSLEVPSSVLPSDFLAQAIGTEEADGEAPDADERERGTPERSAS